MAIEENLARQRQLYGEPLADIAGRIRGDLLDEVLADEVGEAASAPSHEA